MKKTGLMVGAVAVAVAVATSTHGTRADVRNAHVAQHTDSLLRTLSFPRTISLSSGAILVAPEKGCLIKDVYSPWVNMKTGEQIPGYSTVYLCDKAHRPTRAEVTTHVINPVLTHDGTLTGSHHSPAFTLRTRPHLMSLAPSYRETRGTQSLFRKEGKNMRD